MTFQIAVEVAIIAAFLTHYLASTRFKNELKIKKQEKIVNDAKELANKFEMNILSRIHLTRDYLYEMKRAKSKNTKMNEEFRREYREMIKDWNLNLDYTSSFMLRNNIIKRIKSLDELQEKLKEYHSFFYFNADRLSELEHEKIDGKLKSLSELQAYCYRFMQSINLNIDNKWNFLINKRGFKDKIIFHSIDYIIKTLLIYIVISIGSFVFCIFFP